MSDFLIYVIKSALCLAAFGMLYRLLLSKESFHRSNRLTLLGILLLSWVFPLMKVGKAGMTVISKAMWSLEELLLMAEMNQDAAFQVLENSVPLYGSVICLLYITGVSFFLFRTFFSLVKMLLLFHRCRMERLEHGIRLLVHSENVSPFSWMNIIVVSQHDLLEDGEVILSHEYAHVRNRHSWDLLLAEICVIIQWFNPVMWLVRQELKLIHEYEADEYVIRQGGDAKSYQLVLIKKAVGTRLYSMANSLNHSSLKKRITMMIKKKSNPWARLKYLYILPMATIAITAFARPEISERMDEISSVKVNELTSIVKAKEAKSDEKLTVLGNNIPLGDKVQNPILRKEPLILVDGIKKSVSDMNLIHPETIESMHVWKGEEALKKYGEVGKNGVIEIKLKKKGF